MALDECHSLGGRHASTVDVARMRDGVKDYSLDICAEHNNDWLLCSFMFL